MLSCTSSLEPLPTRLVASHTYFPAESLSTFCMTKLFSLIMIFRFVVGVNCIPYNGIKGELELICVYCCQYPMNVSEMLDRLQLKCLQGVHISYIFLPGNLSSTWICCHIAFKINIIALLNI